MSDPFRASFSTEIKPESDELFILIPEDLGPTTSPKLCIYRVPRSLRRVNPSAYKPILVSIGPLHHGDEGLHAMETQKLRYLQHFCKRTGKSSSELAVPIKEKEVTIRRCYEESSKLCSKNFIRMIMLDSVFIIELFLRKYEKDAKDDILSNPLMESEDANDYILSNPLMESEDAKDYILSNPLRESDIKRDLMILENQLPWFILEDLYNFSFPNKTYPVSFIELADNFMEVTWRRYDQSDQKQNKLLGDCGAAQQENPMLHIVDLVRKEMTSGLESPKRSSKGISKLYKATTLNEAGVKFRLSSRESPQLRITFKEGVLSMAMLRFGDMSESIYRNVMAFEQCHLPYHSYVCDLIVFLDYLIDSEEDVDLLGQSGVIVNSLGDSEEVSRMVKKLCKEITSTGSVYYDLSEELNAHADNWWNHWWNPWWNRTKVTLKNVYCANLWRGTSTVAAVVLLVLTFIQTFYSVKQH